MELSCALWAMEQVSMPISIHAALRTPSGHRHVAERGILTSGSLILLVQKSTPSDALIRVRFLAYSMTFAQSETMLTS